MVKSNDGERCVCGEPSCSGCGCGTDCPFLPGHPDGTHATEPLSALIEAARGLLNNLATNEYYNDHEQEPTCGQVYPDVRRLHATLAYALQHQQALDPGGRQGETASEQVERCDGAIDFAIASIGQVLSPSLK